MKCKILHLPSATYLGRICNRNNYFYTELEMSLHGKKDYEFEMIFDYYDSILKEVLINALYFDNKNNATKCIKEHFEIVIVESEDD